MAIVVSSVISFFVAVILEQESIKLPHHLSHLIESGQDGRGKFDRLRAPESH